ncbi:hypothetical protein ACXYUI_33470, partial [Klebsiella pneumoniae]
MDLQLPIAAWPFAVAAFTHSVQSMQAVHEGHREHAAKTAREQAAQAVMGRELALARAIQDSLVTPL